MTRTEIQNHRAAPQTVRPNPNDSTGAVLFLPFPLLASIIEDRAFSFQRYAAANAHDVVMVAARGTDVALTLDTTLPARTGWTSPAGYAVLDQGGGRPQAQVRSVQ